MIHLKQSFVNFKHRVDKITILDFGSALLTLCIVFCPILLVYKVVFTITFFDFLSCVAICTILVGLFVARKSRFILNDVYLRIVPFIIVVLMSLFFSILVYGFYLDIFLRTLRYLYYLSIVLFFAKFFKKRMGMSVFRWVCVISTFFIFLQFFVLKIFGIYISGFVKFLPMIDESLKTIGEGSKNINLRPRSFFQEPAHYGAYVSIFLFLDFMYEKRNKISPFIDFALIGGVVISSSTTGIVMSLLTVLLYFIKILIDKRKREIVLYSAFFTIGFVGLLILLFAGKLDNVIEKVTSAQSFLSRIGTYKDVYNFSTVPNGIMSFLLGRGMVNATLYFAGYPRIIFYFGTIGLLAFSYALITNKKGLPYIIFYMVLNIGTVSALSPFVILFFCTYIKVTQDDLSLLYSFFPLYSKKDNLFLEISI